MSAEIHPDIDFGMTPEIIPFVFQDLRQFLLTKRHPVQIKFGIFTLALLLQSILFRTTDDPVAFQMRGQHLVPCSKVLFPNTVCKHKIIAVFPLCPFAE